MIISSVKTTKGKYHGFIEIMVKKKKYLLDLKEIKEILENQHWVIKKKTKHEYLCIYRSSVDFDPKMIKIKKITTFYNYFDGNCIGISTKDNKEYLLNVDNLKYVLSDIYFDKKTIGEIQYLKVASVWDNNPEYFNE